LLLIVGVVLFYFGWGWSNSSAIDREIARLAAAGEPVKVEDLRPAGVAAEDNGYVQIRAALAALAAEDANSPLNQARDTPRLPLFDDERSALRDAVETQRTALAALRPAIQKPVVAADHVKFTSPALNVMLPDLNHLRKLANAAARSAMLEHDAGRHDRALEELAVIEPLARGAASHASLVGTLVAIGLRALEADTIVQMAPELRVGRRDGDVSPEQLRATIERLLDDKALRDELRLGYQAERIFQIDTMQCLADGRLTLSQVSAPGGVKPGSGSPSAVFRAVGRPFLWSNARYSLDYMSRLIALLGAPDWPTAKRQADPLERELTQDKRRWRYVLASILLPSLARAQETHYRVIADRRLAATALAVRAYQVDHDGAPPPKLNDLVPTYLKTVPMDPMAAGMPLCYRSEGDEPAIWSVGENGLDDGGSRAPNNSRPVEPGDRWTTRDAAVPLKTERRQRSALAEEGQEPPMNADERE
jgi:hypothetical protein